MHVYKAHLLGDLPTSPGNVTSTAPTSETCEAESVIYSDLMRNAPYSALAGLSPQQRAAWQHAQALRVMRKEAAEEHSQAVVALK